MIEDSEKIEDGRWQCDKGNWHNAGGECRCNLELVEGEDGMVRLQQKSAPALPEPEQAERGRFARSNNVAVSVKSF